MYKRKNSLRLNGYDYAQAGAYFVTILAYRRLHHFGHISNDEMTYSALGDLAAACWNNIPKHFPSVEIDLFVIMPNHTHGILVLDDSLESRPTLSQIINTYKGSVTRLARHSNLIDPDYPIWHRSFHDHIIRNESSLNYIRNYVLHNPSLWEKDSLR